MLFFNCYFQACIDCVRPSTVIPQTVTNLGSFPVNQHPELLQTSPQEEHCQTSRRPGSRFADASLILEGMTSLQTTLEGLFK